MKFIFSTFFLFVSLSSLAQEKGASCEVTLTKKEFLEHRLPLKCFKISNDSVFKSLSYKIKFLGKPAVDVSGDFRISKARYYLQTAKTGDNIYIFDIMLDNDNIVIPKNISVTLKKN
ncbi:hypothetical protein [Corallibacter sp.]|uniref:hypothetical protein n=1 Tax=Corallibacter sp. TaxID=2038084 RepID=UPI003AB8F188